MTPEKRNTAVVGVLVITMTAGLLVLLGLESLLVPHQKRWTGNIALSAAVRSGQWHVEVHYAATLQDVDPEATSLADLDPSRVRERNSICVIDSEGRTGWWPRGEQIDLYVVGWVPDRDPRGDRQKHVLIAALGTISQRCGYDVVPVRLAAELDPRENPSMPDEARRLRVFLERKGFIARSGGV